MNPKISETIFHERHPSFYASDGIYYPDSDGEPMAETDFHINLIVDLRLALERFFAERDNVYVSGNIFFYYMEGAPNEIVSPDIMVCFGVPKGERRFYQLWKENDVVPSVIFEIASRKTWSKNRNEKKQLYELLGVKEYFIFNPEYPKRIPALIAYRLENGEFKSVVAENGRVQSGVLGLDVIDTGKTLRLFNPQTESFLPTNEELAKENVALKSEIERLKALLEK
jgi:Uma2 family endonuclease